MTTVKMKKKIDDLGDLATAYIDAASKIADEQFKDVGADLPETVLQIAAIMISLDSPEHRRE